MKKIPRAALPIATVLFCGGAILTLLLTSNSFDGFMDEHGHGHGHVAPHGGTLIMLGLHTAHVEIALEAESGRLYLYALDDEAVNLYALPATPITLEIRLAPEEDWHPLSLQPDDDPAYRLTESRSQRFSVVDPALIGRTRFDLRLPELTFAGRTFPKLTTRFPEGNH